MDLYFEKTYEIEKILPLNGEVPNFHACVYRISFRTLVLYISFSRSALILARPLRSRAHQYFWKERKEKWNNVCLQARSNHTRKRKIQLLLSFPGTSVLRIHLPRITKVSAGFCLTLIVRRFCRLAQVNRINFVEILVRYNDIGMTTNLTVELILHKVTSSSLPPYFFNSSKDWDWISKRNVCSSIMSN